MLSPSWLPPCVQLSLDTARVGFDFPDNPGRSASINVLVYWQKRFLVEEHVQHGAQCDPLPGVAYQVTAKVLNALNTQLCHLESSNGDFCLP